ncbi:MAG: hypothetical protein D6767_05550 [Candidatus Hydrogenedentota bacterium]|nr:MAG: hypothetical protein D6767_05550 [Candidatus Hydrogenedentota bacterium]
MSFFLIKTPPLWYYITNRFKEETMSKIFEQYRKEEKENPNPSCARNNRKRATFKIKVARYAYLRKEFYEMKEKEKLNDNTPYIPKSRSSMTLPNFTGRSCASMRPRH